MNSLIRHNLDYNKVLEFVKEQLEDVNILSIELLKMINFSKGMFFTLLPKDFNKKNLYKFTEGGILPQNPMEEYYIKGKICFYSRTPCIDDILANILVKIIKNNKKLTCMIDDFNKSAKGKHHMELFNAYGMSYNDEVYYSLNKENITKKNIMDCLKSSLTFWHSLGLVFEGNLNDKNLTLDRINYICLNTKMIFVGAYDGEGYVFWEKNEDNLLIK